MQVCKQQVWPNIHTRYNVAGNKVNGWVQLLLSPFLDAASFLSLRSFSRDLKTSCIRFTSACFFLTSQRTASAASFSSCSWDTNAAFTPNCIQYSTIGNRALTQDMLAFPLKTVLSYRRRCYLSFRSNYFHFSSSWQNNKVGILRSRRGS